MCDLIDLEVYDEDKNRFSPELKVDWLNRAQDHILGMINSQYVVSLHAVDVTEAVTLPGGISPTPCTIDFSALTYTVFRKHLGIMGIRNATGTGGLFLDYLDFNQYRQLISDGHTFATTNPAYMVRGSTIYMYPSTITHVDVYYMREPVNMVYNVASGNIAVGKVYTVTEYPYINGSTYAVTYNSVAYYDGQSFTGVTGKTTYTTSGVGTVSIPCELEDDIQDAVVEYAMHFGHELNGADQRADRKVARAYNMVQVINNKIDPENVAVRPIARTAGVVYRPDAVTNNGGR
jgi:hypothetical protein